MTVGNINTFISSSATTPTQGASLALLDTHVAAGTENTYTFTPSSALTPANYSEIYVVISGQSTAALAIQMKINGDAANYDWFGIRCTTAATSVISGLATTLIQLLSNTAIAGAQGFRIEVHIPLDTCSAKQLGGFSKGYAINVASEDINFDDLTGSVNTITSLTFQTSASTWIAGTTITTYGVKRA